MRIDLVGTTADFRGFGPPPSLPINHLLCENPQTAGRIGEDGLGKTGGSFGQTDRKRMVADRRYLYGDPKSPSRFSPACLFVGSIGSPAAGRALTSRS